MTFKTKRLLVKFKPCIQDGKFNFENSYSNKKIDILNLQPSDPEHMTFQFYSKEDNTNICHIALTNKRGKLEVSYGTEPFFRNKGYMTEALAFAVKWIFENTTEDSIWALPNGDISKTILETCGFTDYGVFEDAPKMHWFKIERDFT